MSVRPSVGLSVRPSVRHTWVETMQKCRHQTTNSMSENASYGRVSGLVYFYLYFKMKERATDVVCWWSFRFCRWFWAWAWSANGKQREQNSYAVVSNKDWIQIVALLWFKMLQSPCFSTLICLEPPPFFQFFNNKRKMNCELVKGRWIPWLPHKHNSYIIFHASEREARRQHGESAPHFSKHKLFFITKEIVVVPFEEAHLQGACSPSYKALPFQVFHIANSQASCW